MELEVAKNLALMHMNEHGLLDNGWKFQFDRAKRRLGFCSHKKKTISLSMHYVPLLEYAEVLDTTLHEIAHALVGKKQGHNKEWKQKAIEIGCNGERLYHGEAHVKPKYKGTCPTCGRTIQRHMRKRISCSRCCKGRFNEAHLFVWSLNE